MKDESIKYHHPTMKNLEKIQEKIERIDTSLDGIRVTLARQEEHLAHHIRRTDLLEEAVQLMREELKPISVHVEMMNKLSKLFSLAVGTGAAITAILVAASRFLHP